MEGPKMSSLTDLKGTYVIDVSHSRIGFSAGHAMVTKVRGGFSQFEGTAQLNGEDPTASNVNISIQSGSFDSGVQMRDDHVKSGDFLDIEAYPTLSFTSTDVKVTGPDTFDLTGNLTIKDQTHAEEHTSELQSRQYLVCRLLLEKHKNKLSLLVTSHTYVLLAGMHRAEHVS